MMDYISREEVIAALRKNQEIYLNSDDYENDSIDNYTIAIIDIDILTVEDLPAAPVRVKRGEKMVSASEEGTAFFVCSECGLPIDSWDKFCRHCGADMREE